MNMSKMGLGALLLAFLVAFQACASGAEEEKLPVFQVDRAGWQWETIEKGFDRLAKADARLFQTYLKAVSTMHRQKYDILLRDFIGPSFELYASAGTGFVLKKEGGRKWKAVLTVLTERTELSLLRAVVYKAQDVGSDRLVTFKVSAFSKSRQFPFFDEAGGGERYVFRGYLNLSPAEFPASASIEHIIMRALERMSDELPPGASEAFSGKVYLVEHRLVYVSGKTLGVYCKLAVELD